MVEEQFKMVQKDLDTETIIDGETESENVARTATSDRSKPEFELKPKYLNFGLV
jgi:hypothetical protein